MLHVTVKFILFCCKKVNRVSPEWTASICSELDKESLPWLLLVLLGDRRSLLGLGGCTVMFAPSSSDPDDISDETLSRSRANVTFFSCFSSWLRTVSEKYLRWVDLNFVGSYFKHKRQTIIKLTFFLSADTKLQWDW